MVTKFTSYTFVNMKGIKISEKGKQDLKVATAHSNKSQKDTADEGMALVRDKYEPKQK